MGFLFLLVPLFWLLVFGLVIGLVGRRWRRRAFAAGMGQWGAGHGHGHGYGYWGASSAARAAEATLAERFAQGDIDEKEYRARLEVLRANVPQPPTA
jgi:putative membrane protein